MSPKSTILICLQVAAGLAVARTANAGLDLTPSANDYVAEGMKFRQLVFQHDKQRIEYEPPPNWTFDSTTKRLHLKVPNKNFADATIEAIPLAAAQPMTEERRAAIRQQFLATLPPGSELSKVEAETENPILLNGKPTFEITISYHAMGEKFLRSGLFVNLPDVQLVFRLSARAQDFAALHQEFKASLLSWHWIDAGETKPQ
jgi:hypothetical protein